MTTQALTKFCYLLAVLLGTTVPCSASLYISWYAGNGNYDIESFDLHNAHFVFGTEAYSEPIVLDLTQTFSFHSELQNLLRIEEYIAPQLVIERSPDPSPTSASSTGLGLVMTMVHMPIVVDDQTGSKPLSDMLYPAMPEYYDIIAGGSRSIPPETFSLHSNIGIGFETVPEPSTLLLFGCGITTFVMMKKGRLKIC